MVQQTESISAIPESLAVRQPGVNVKFFAAGGLLVVAVLFLVVQGVMAGGAYFLTISELHAKPNVEGQRVRVNGAVVEASEVWDAKAMTLQFAIEDEDGAQLPVVFYGPRPDNFQRAVSAIVEGELLADGTFEAQTLLLKCPSRYEEEPEEILSSRRVLERKQIKSTS